MPTVFRSNDFADWLEREIEEHLIEPYVVRVGREENRDAFGVRLWRLDETKDVQGEEDLVGKVYVGYMHCIMAPKKFRPLRQIVTDVMNRLADDIMERLS